MATIAQNLTQNCSEFDLLICCARTKLSSKAIEQINSILERDIDWKLLLQLAERNRVRPLLYWHLKELSNERVPKDVLRSLDESFRSNLQLNLYLTQELLKLLNLFETHEVPAIPFKGPTLTQVLYGNLALREFGDLDILVPQQHVVEAKKVLIDIGFQTLFQLSPRQEVGYLESQCEYYFVRSDRHLPVEIHWRLFPRYFTFAMDLESVTKRLISVPLGGKQLSTFSAEDLLLYLCAHGAKHSWSRLAWVTDISELLRAYPQIDWQHVTKQATDLGGERMLYLGLRLANELLGTDLPKEIEQQIQTDSAIPALIKHIRLTMVQEATEASGDTDFEGLLFPLRTRERWRDRVLYCLRLVMFPTGGERWKRINLPPALLPFYYLLWRPVELLIRGGSYLLGRLFWQGSAVRKPGL